MKIRELLTSAARWTKKSAAKTSTGAICSWDNRKAVRFCLWGALHKCYPNSLDKRLAIHTRIIAKIHKAIDIWNDDPKTKFKDVKALVEELDI